MRTIQILLFCLLASPIFAQELPETEIESEVNEVTVFIDKAQITRHKKIDLQKGKTLLRFKNLSPFIDAKSIQVKTIGDFTVLAVNHNNDFTGKLEKPQQVKAIEAKIEANNNARNLERTYLEIVQSELQFLNSNRNIAGQNNGLNLTTLKEVSSFYSTKLKELKLKEIEHNKKLHKLSEEYDDLLKQLKNFSSQKKYPSGEVRVEVDATKALTASISLSYLVSNAGWYPTYDIRAKDINSPLQVRYKANIRQDTKIDWKNVKLNFSSANPSASMVAPKLKTYFLDFNSRPPVYNLTTNKVSGRVTDSNNQALPGTTVMVEGTTIGTVTDINGNYTLTLPQGAETLTFSFIGFKQHAQAIYGSTVNVQLEEDVLALDEVVVVGYGVQRDYEADDEIELALTGSAAGVQTKRAKPKSAKIKNKTVPFENVEQQTNVSFEIKTPYTVKSNNTPFAVDMVIYQIPADYQYFAVPKIKEEAFLLAHVTDWQQYNLLEGEANLFFEDTYMGKTILDVRSASDTLQLSLGTDKNVVVKREKAKDFTSRQFIGSKKEETRSWNTTIRNNKNQTINMIVFDQVPVSAREEIEIKIEEQSGGKRDNESGSINWEFSLEPQKTENIRLQYSVKYPKWQNIILE